MKRSVLAFCVLLLVATLAYAAGKKLHAATLILQNGSGVVPTITGSDTSSNSGFGINANDAVQIICDGSSVMSWNTVNGSVKRSLSADDGVVYMYNAQLFEQGDFKTSLTDGASNTIFTVSVNAGEWTGGTIHYSIECSNGTDLQVVSGTVVFALAYKSGTADATITEISEVLAETNGSSTLTVGWAVDTNPDDTFEFAVTPDSSLTPTTLQIRWHVVSTSHNSQVITGS